jgi:hypothetical protein
MSGRATLHCAPNNPFGHGTDGSRSAKIADHNGGSARVLPVRFHHLL